MGMYTWVLLTYWSFLILYQQCHQCLHQCVYVSVKQKWERELTLETLRAWTLLPHNHNHPLRREWNHCSMVIPAPMLCKQPRRVISTVSKATKSSRTKMVLFLYSGPIIVHPWEGLIHFCCIQASVLIAKVTYSIQLPFYLPYNQE